MASPTRKTRRRRDNKKSGLGSKRKREARREVRKKILAIAEQLGLKVANQTLNT